MPALKPLAQQVMVITGASSGIGLATARRAAQAGTKVVLVARNAEALDEVEVEIRNRGGQAIVVDGDVADPQTHERAAGRAVEEFGGFDTWVNNAAAAMYARLNEVSLEEHKRIFDVGYFGTVNGATVAARHLRGRGGAIINVGSVLSDRAVLVQGPYCAMKHAVKGYTDALRMELENEGAGISVSLIKPNGIDTPYPEHARNKMGRPATIPPVIYDPKLVAKAICFCAENRKRMLTVGGGGLLLTAFAPMAPGLADKAEEAGFDEKMQTIDTPPEPGASDNLFEPREDGREHSNQDLAVRGSSLYLEAQMRPFTAAAIVGGAVAAAAGAYALTRRKPNGAMAAAMTAKQVGAPKKQEEQEAQANPS